MSGNLAFDTYDYVKRLQLVGFSEPQTKIQVALHKEVFSMQTEKLVTKDRFKNGIAEVKADIEYLKLTIQNDIKLLGVSTNNAINLQDIKFMNKFNILYTLIGVLIGTNISIILKLFVHS